MHATTYGGARAPATAVVESKRVKPRKSIFARFMDGLKESRLAQARRVIEKHNHLMAPDNLRGDGAQAKDETMKRYLIERDIPGVGNLSAGQLKGVAAKSNGVLARLAPKVQWLESFVAADKTFCVYLAESEALVFEHAELGGFPVTKVTEVPTVISPMTAY